MSKLLWWGYRHIDGSVHIKRFFDDRDIQEADESDFVAMTTGPYQTDDRDEAEDLIQNALVVF